MYTKTLKLPLIPQLVSSVCLQTGEALANGSGRVGSRITFKLWKQPWWRSSFVISVMNVSYTDRDADVRHGVRVKANNTHM